MKFENFDTRTDSRWLTPVWIRVGKGAAEAVRGPGEALEKLMYRWPNRVDAHYLLAKARCMDALSDSSKSHSAREKFIRAAIEAQMLD